MIRCSTGVILAAESRAQDGEHLLRSLAGLERPVVLALSVQEALAVMRRMLLEAAVVAAELGALEQPLLERLWRLPTLGCLVAVGPPDQPELERQARMAGANAYLIRPVRPEQLREAMARSLNSMEFWHVCGRGVPGRADPSHLLSPAGHLPGKEQAIAWRWREQTT